MGSQSSNSEVPLKRDGSLKRQSFSEINCERDVKRLNETWQMDSKLSANVNV